MINVEPVVFENASGYKLFGIIHEPETIDVNIPAILLLSPGIKTRVAPHRLYNKIANKLANEGYTVLRFDFYGLGDSEGEINEKYLADLYENVSTGLFIEDTKYALDWMQNEKGFSKFILGGLCGGAVTGLLAGCTDNRVVGLFTLAIPVITYSPNIDKGKYITQGQLRNMRTGYIRKILSLQSWARLLTFKSDFRVISKVLLQIIKEKKNKPAIEKNQPVTDATRNDDNLNELFPPAFFSMAERGVKMLLIFGGSDRLAHEYSEKFSVRYAVELDKHKEAFELFTIKNANHILSSKEWQQEMLYIAKKWLNANFNAPLRPLAS